MRKISPNSVLSNDSLLAVLEKVKTTGKFWIAYSGGMDSSVLLHLFYSNKKTINNEIEVIYINHGLQEEADDWGEFCQQQCKKYNFSFIQIKIHETCPKGKSIEAWAREKRYQLIENLINNEDVLFTGHHQDDQIETFFLQALRGAGPRGLSAMPLIRTKENYLHVRPLLNYPRDRLKNYAIQHNLIWQDDKSNHDNRYDRNYFRNEVTPVINKRWPAYRHTLNRLIENQQESRILLNELALTDMKHAQQGENKCLDLGFINKLNVHRQKNLIFFWLDTQGLQTPGSRHIEKIISDIINSEREKSPCVNWANVEVRRYKNCLYAQKTLSDFNVKAEFIWQPETVLNIFEETLSAELVKGKGISKDKLNKNNLVVKFRKGGEKIKPGSSAYSKTVKQLFQEKSVLPWYRDKIPLIYVNDDLAAIPGFCVDEKYIASRNEASWDICWSGYNKAIQL